MSVMHDSTVHTFGAEERCAPEGPVLPALNPQGCRPLGRLAQLHPLGALLDLYDLCVGMMDAASFQPFLNAASHDV
eukprot:scaffold48095_cov23-Tisochrysis_lutea.AAC.1